MIVVDSSVWIDHYRDNLTHAVQVIRSIQRASDVAVGELILLEVLRGARDEGHARKLEASLRTFRIVPMMSLAVAVEAARIYRDLRAEGTTIRKTVDLAIATFCILNGHRLLQSDRDFLPIAARFPLRLV